MAGAREEMVRIGCASGFWGDSDGAAAQLVGAGIDYLVFDYLAEITMSLLARARLKDPTLGYATDFVTSAMARVLREVVARKIKVVANAGGVNPLACRDALVALMAKLGVEAKVAVVLGDDVSDRMAAFRAEGIREMESGTPIPEKLTSANAYLGARPIAAALDAGADIVITGRCVDSAVVLGPLMHEFGWRDDEYDLLAAGSLLGHLVECGCMATGGVFTDWEAVEGWDEMGFPIVECFADGTAVLTKPKGTGGLVTPANVAEQMLYEIGDPRAYHLPDVVCDWTGVTLRDAGPDRVAISGARGRVPTPFYKICATHMDGYRATTSLTIAGGDAARKARRVGEAILAKSRRLLRDRNLGDYEETSIEVIGAEDMYGAAARPVRPREVMLKAAVHHRDKEGVAIFAREIAPAITATAPGITGFFAGRPGTVPVVRLFSCLVEKSAVPVEIDVAGTRRPIAIHPGSPEQLPPPAETAPQPASGDRVAVPLNRLAHARSGDKGDMANTGADARRFEFVPLLREALTADIVARHFAHFAKGTTTRYEVPGVDAFNFVLTKALGGGGIASLRIDPQGKCFAPILLDAEVSVPRDAAERYGLIDAAA
ncbi:MAG: DUF1446 domain-containing protein [Rhodospirillaceae bacterium]|nr:DUF1446 domain-containing protein [Rhodospirillaceae bacterium]